MELRVRADVLAANGTDIGITGSTSAEKMALWERHQRGEITRDELVAQIATLFATSETTSDTKVPYSEHYGNAHHDAWVENNPADASKPLPPL